MTRQLLRFELNRPLLIVKERHGFLACGYISVDTANRTGDACAIVSGVDDYEAMSDALVVAVSEAAKKLGVQVGDTGASALAKLS